MAARQTPDVRGKRWFLIGLRWLGVKRGRRFPWRMENGSWLLLDPREGLIYAETVGWTCFLKRRWEPHIETFMRATLRPGDTAIDVGANIGYFTAVMAAAVTRTGQVVSFEPVPDVLGALKGAIDLNEFQNVDVFGCALGAASATAEIQVDPRFAGNSSLHAEYGAAGSRVQVSVRTLDDLISCGDVAIGGLRLIKIDVEGSELDVLRGAVQAIRRWRPWIVFEFNPATTAAAGWTIRDALCWFEELGDYTLYALTDDGLQAIPTQPLADGQFIDLVAMPRGETGT